tara:strand:+ start:867 stop:2489 length:1623 start_codon:yes stop_codon:yes gene_type:complete
MANSSADLGVFGEPGSLTGWRWFIFLLLFLYPVACSVDTSDNRMAASTTLAQRVTTSSSAPQTSTTTSVPLSKTTMPTTSLAAAVQPITSVPPYDGWWDPEAVGLPWGDTVRGVLTFRGSPTRSWYGGGPVPLMPEVLWRFPEQGDLCSLSTTGGRTTNWCGIGWTGQPAVWELENRTWLAIGAYDRGIHVLDASTGTPILEPFVTGDIVKGSLTVDPDGFPLIYSGSRDGQLRILAFDRPDRLVELWSMAGDEVNPVMWNDDWDGAPLILKDHLITGGENSWFHIIRLNRSLDPSGTVTVDPEIVFQAPGWDRELLSALGDNNVSIENSLAVSGDTVWFANSGGLVQGWDLSPLQTGDDPVRNFRWWMGDDVDATIVIDNEGFLYVAAEYERATARSREVGQLVKLDPSKPETPVVWSVHEDGTLPGGFWSTPALHRDVLYVATNSGKLMSVDRYSGKVLWSKRLEGPLWGSPVVVGDILIIGDCGGYLRAYGVQQPDVEPIEIWRVEIGGCLEATPTVWEGRIYIGSREGGLFALGER